MAFSAQQIGDVFSTNGQTLRYFLYARKSTDEQTRQVLSIDAQLHELRTFAIANRLKVVKEFTESRTAKAPGRPVFNEMIASIERNEADGIIAWHSDRLSRNSLDSGRIIYLTDTCVIKDLQLVQERFDRTPHGKFSLGISFVQNKYYIDNLSENVKRGLRAKVRMGHYPRPAPLGYMNDRNDHTILIHPEEGPKVLLLFERYAQGDIDIRGLCTFATSLGIKGRRGNNLRMSSLQPVLRNVFYTGLFRFNGEVHQGVHPPLVTRELFDRVQNVMSNRSRKITSPLKPFPYRGILKCAACGHQITMETHKGHTYLRCAQSRSVCRSPFVRQERVDEAIFDVLTQLVLPNDVIQALEQFIKFQKNNIETTAVEETVRYNRQIQELEEKIHSLIEMRLKGQLTEHEFAEMKSQAVDRKQRFVQELASFRRAPTEIFEPFETLILRLGRAADLVTSKKLAETIELLKNASSNLNLNGPVLSAELKKPYELVVKWKCEHALPGKKPSEAETCTLMRTLSDVLRIKSI
jgi:site-specific DNA recombinase